MVSLDHTVTPEPSVKSEVSDAGLQHTGEQSDDEGLLSSTHDNTKRVYEDEQDLSLDSNGNGSPLPPRKRAKTQEEKEQRRVERIMRNRQAAHASREKKRKHLETLETKCSQLETENAQLRTAMSGHNHLKARLEQLEVAIKLAKSTGKLDSLDSILTSPTVPQPEATGANGTVAGMVVGATPCQEPEIHSQPQFSGSPAPSLEEDCASPDALFIKSEEDLFPPYSPEKPSEVLEDPFGMMNFSFDSNPVTSGTQAYPESSSKSRHPAALTHLPIELEFMDGEES